LPIAHSTGGLADTIDEGETGILFSDLSGEGRYSACQRAFEALSDADALTEMRQAAMARSFHWSGAAVAYEYRRLLGHPIARLVAHATKPRGLARPAAAELQAAA
jgi:starch synthase